MTANDDKPDIGKFIVMVLALFVAACAGVLAYGALWDGWNSNNPWLFVPAGLVLAIGYVIFAIYRLVGAAKSANYREALRRAKEKKRAGQLPPA